MFDVGRGGQGAQHVAQPQIRLEAVGLGGFYQAIELGAGGRALGRVAKQPVLSSNRERPDAVFSKIIRYVTPVIFKISLLFCKNILYF